MKQYKKARHALPIFRAIGVLSAVGVITTLVTFAAIQSTGNALTGNTIETATATLQISKDGSTFSDSIPGYDFNSIVPGGPAQPVNNGGYLVALKNTGTTNLNLSLSVPKAPVVTGITDLSKVYVSIRMLPAAGGDTYGAQSIKLSDLIAGPVPVTNGSLGIGGTNSYRLQVAMDADAVSGSGATISGLDLSFSGTPQ